MKAAFLLTLALIWPMAGMTQGVTVDTAAGSAEAPAAPATVVALDFAALDTLTALRVTVAGRPDLTPPAYLAGALDGVPTVGTIFEPDFEALAVMAPDLIVAGGRSQPQVAALSQLAPTLDMTIGGADLVADARSRLAAYGAIFGKDAEARALDADLDAEIAAARAAVHGRGTALIAMTSGGRISVFGAGSRFGWLHTALDLPQAAPDLRAGDHGEAVSFEFVARTNPDWLLVIDRDSAIGQGGAAAGATMDNALIAGTKAAKAGRIVYLDGAAAYLADGGVQSLRLILGQLTRAFGADTAG